MPSITPPDEDFWPQLGQTIHHGRRPGDLTGIQSWHIVVGAAARRREVLRGSCVSWCMAVAATLWVGGVYSLVAAQTQSLGAVAEKAAEKRKASGEPSKVYTNADLKPVGDTAPIAGVAAEGSPTPTVPLIDSSRELIVRAVTPAIVTISQGRTIGSGFFIAPSVVVTNRHVVDGAGGAVQVTSSNGRTSRAWVTSTASDADLALLRVDTPPVSQPVLPLGSAMTARPGEELLVIGSSLGLLHNTVTRGIVSAVRTIGGLTYVQTDAAINPGNSGAPVIRSDGRVIGIVTLKATAAESLGFALAIDHAKTLLQGRTSVRSSADSSDNVELEREFNRPVKSPTDVAAERGTIQFDAAVRALAQRANEIDLLWKRYESACSGQQATGAVYGRAWFGVWSDPIVIDNATLPECRGLWSDVVTFARRIRAGMQVAEEDARRAGVYPGIRRDIRKKYAMDWPGWDK